jgi:phosphatidylserine/phosphatidylglycerophosphate/cardiolipin synthase-like enzyme
MKIKCDACGKETAVGVTTLKALMGGSLMAGGAIGWVTYAFAGLLSFSGGAATIATLLLAGGGAVLLGKDLGLVMKVGGKITEQLNQRGYECPSCGATNWVFFGFKDAEVIKGSEHKITLQNAFLDANRELYIASGFLSANVVDASFLKELKLVLSRGVRVVLIFSDLRSHSDSGWMKTGYENAYILLASLSEEQKGLKLIQKHTHQKGIVVDKQYAVVGSFNFLSNQTVAREETSLKVYEADAIEKLIEEFVSR